MLVRLAVFSFGAVPQKRQIGFKTADGYIATYHSGFYSAAWFTGVRAIVESAFCTNAEDLTEIMAHLFALHIYRTEAFDTRGVDDSTILQKVHLGESGGVHTFVVGIGDLACTGHLLTEERIEKGGFAYS